ncbi:DNA-directed RNA polymerase I and III subunit RPAC1 [Penicillium pulvis]|uniref:DNA-directed RNA polymerases I and III subunit RPAC1 n=1 Tax=Penicillium frequentans TaxID=3151616 RepID=A0AAD6CP61_9EURO|nr:DNA-directed RNA polymerase I and III subunit RPAC1 [Penicillium pulvis]KAJ5526275.1 DNA-directed RNA polymerase I and III subunit RPAC1 [Penicillium glabrum]KAJ5544213.1 DNA-directed RNA polymerase I and III subunit RPAC1 [Penicillium glabrum]KAJ5784378.1 DNA-directed RNA polymerase I and III subunit RPAC1 [Penicillium pulvis]
MAPLVPSQEELQRRRIIGVNAETVTNIPSTDFPGHWPGESHGWALDQFKNDFKVEYHRNDPYEASFSLIGLDAAVANAFRRILMAEIPTLAIETVYVHNNTSVIQDEVLAQRLGLIPLKGSVEGINWMQWEQKAPGDEGSAAPELTDFNTVVMQLDIECTQNPDVADDETDPRKLYNNAHVYSKHLTFTPVGRQEQFFVGDGAIRAVQPDILIAKMRPGQKIEMELHCVKGIGADHAKFSPVATASYRLLPDIQILRPIIGEDAKKFAKCFPKGVIGLEPVTSEEASRAGSGYEGHAGEQKAVVKDAFNDTVSRECLRHEEFQGKVKLGRVRDHFIFNVESSGQFESDTLFLESVKVLKLKCARWKRGLNDLMA